MESRFQTTTTINSPPELNGLSNLNKLKEHHSMAKPLRDLAPTARVNRTCEVMSRARITIVKEAMGDQNVAGEEHFVAGGITTSKMDNSILLIFIPTALNKPMGTLSDKVLVLIALLLNHLRSTTNILFHPPEVVVVPDPKPYQTVPCMVDIPKMAVTLSTLLLYRLPMTINLCNQ